MEDKLRTGESTGIMNGIITVDVAEDVASMHAVNIGKNFEWHRVEFGLSCLRQMGVGCFVPRQTPEDHTRTCPLDPEAAPGSEKSFKTESQKSHDLGKTATKAKLLTAAKLSKQVKQLKAKPLAAAKLTKAVKQVKALQQAKRSPDVMANIRKLLKKEGFSAVRPFLEKKSSLYLSDTGGQIEFQELLPLLVAGYAIFVFLFPLNRDLDEQVTVSYRKKVGGKLEHSNVYTSSLTIRESFLQTLASIDSMEVSPNTSIAKHNSYVFVVGTHKDCLVEDLGEDEAGKRIVEINGKIKNLIKEHKYEKLVVYADKAEDQVFFAVDNTSQNDSFLKIRKSIMDLLHSRDEFRIQFPLSYLLASLHLQDSSKPFIRRSDFAQDVLQYGIEEEDVDHLLQFLSARIGQIRYFPMEEIREIIVKEPQALYNLVTYLITKSFISQSITMEEYSEVQRGIYSLESFDVEEFLSQSEFLTPKRVIHLLKELRIVAPFYDRAAGVEKYFIPCVLNHLTESPADDPCNTSIVKSLAIMFDCGHCPKGIFGVLLHYILTHQEKQLDWYLDTKKISRDHVSFAVGPYEDVVSVKFHTTHLEVGCSPTDVDHRNQALTVKKICNTIRSTLESGIKEATKSLHYSQVKTKHSLGLVCAECNDIHRVSEVDSQCTMKCPKLGKGYTFLPDSGSLWFYGSK